MGKPGSEPQFNQSSTVLGNDQSSTSINHFSHPHPLQLSQQALTGSLCSGCKNDAPGLVYCCTICNYFLHQKCSQMPQQITHPCDPNHVFSLQPKPIYPEGLFNCDACRQQGNGFSYHCQACGIDLHILCASLPMVLGHQSHQHQLNLTFSPPYPSKNFSCDICQRAGSNHWLYRCTMCEFDVHLTCTNMLPSAPSQPPIQQSLIQQVQNLMIRAIPQPPNPRLPSQNSMPHSFMSNVNPAVNNINPVMNNLNPAPYNSFRPSGIGQAQPPVFGNPYAATTPVQQNFMPVNSFMNPGAYGSVRPAGFAQQNTLRDQVVGGLANGLASGASQAIAGALIQDLMGGGGGGGSGGNGGGTNVGAVTHLQQGFGSTDLNGGYATSVLPMDQGSYLVPDSSFNQQIIDAGYMGADMNSFNQQMDPGYIGADQMSSALDVNNVATY